MQRTIDIKIVIMGDSGIGKSSIVYRFVTQNFNEKMDTTMGAGFMTKIIDCQGYKVRFQIWDTAGQEKFHSLAAIYYRDANVALIVYDISNEQSFEVLKHWIQELQNKGPQNIQMYFVGNKTDLEDQQKVDYSTASQLAKDNNAKIRLTSAKDNIGIDELFKFIAEEFIKKNKDILYNPDDSYRIQRNFNKKNSSDKSGCSC